MWKIVAKKTDRLDRLLRNEAWEGSEWLSRQAWDWLFQHGFIEVNGRKILKAGAEIQAGAVIQVVLPSPTLGLAPAQNSATLVWSSPDRSLGIFTKECGVSSLPIFPWDNTAFANQVAAFVEKNQWMPLSEFAGLAEPPRLEGGVLQRLDRDTSGLICVAFTAPTKRLFRQLFSDSALEKTYFAIVTGNPNHLAGTHRIWLSSGSSKIKAQLTPPKEEAEEVSLSIEVCNASEEGALLKITTRHGARHIVRAGLAALSFPLLGDKTYGGNALAPFHQLHAGRLTLVTAAFPGFPEIATPPPQSFLASLTRLSLHWTG